LSDESIKNKLMTRLSVNINKVATIRNARGGKMPDVTLAAVTAKSSVLKESQCTPDLMRGTSDILT